MFTKNLILSAVMTLMPVLASAAPYPWKKPAKGITVVHKEMAKELKKSLTSKGIEYPLAVNAFTAHWNKKRRIEAISNVEITNLKRLVTGHYFVGTYKPWAGVEGAKGNNITVKYFDKNGAVHSCWGGTGVTQVENSAQWRVIKSYAGFGGILADSKEYFASRSKSLSDDLAYSMAYNATTGQVLYYKNASSRSRHEVYIGHFQKEYAPIFAEICPNLPKVGRVNEAQTSRKYSEFFKQGAKPIKGIPVVFNQDVDDPLTLEKYFTLYPPIAK